ncbi:MAG: hypothetical protein J6K58_14415 [Lachnospiraceae bacterium]|nr:hypothetical protein [Lachnospiraceae bacterium]
MDNRKILPFYMTYPLPLYYEDEHELIKDMEYLQGQHPLEIRTLQGEIVQFMNMMDYSGSMIYDEYPDRFLLQKYGKDIAEKVRRKHKDDVENPVHKMLDWDGFEEIIMLLLHEEILKRRHRRNRGYLRF